MDDLAHSEYIVPTYELLESSSAPSPSRPKGAGRRSVSRLSGNSFSQLAAQVRQPPVHVPLATQLGAPRVGGRPTLSDTFPNLLFQARRPCLALFGLDYRVA